MRRALDPRPATREASFPQSPPAPVGGWNTRDGRADMPITDATMMDNWYPEATDVRPRNGSATYASQIGSQVETILSYDNGATLKLFIAAGNVFQNISTVGTSGTVTAGTVAAGTTAFQNSRFQYRQYGTPGGHFIVAVNGADKMQLYDGSVWIQGTVFFSGTINALSNVEVYQRRLFFLEKDSLRFGYLATDAIAGTISMFDLGSELELGGELVGIGTWTRDGGSGMDDLIAFISDKGQVALYSGINPASATDWVREGIFKIPPPLSVRSTQKFGGELLVGCETGVVPMSGIVSGLVQQTPVTDKIRTSVNDAVNQYRGRFGWELYYCSQLNWLIINVPVAVGNYQQQFVMNTQTGSWCRFLNWDANTFCVHNNVLYFGVNGSVIAVSTSSYSDDGNDISVDVMQAPSTFGMPGRLKQFKMYRPLINSDGSLSLASDISVDFANTVPTDVPSATPITLAEWDVATWDDYFWADDNVPALFWQSSGRLGTYGAVRIKGNVNETSLRWYGTDIVMEPGGML